MAEALSFDIFARDRGASKTLDKVGNSAERAGTSMGSFAAAAKVAAAAGAILGGIRIFGGMIKEANEAAKVGRLTEAVVKSTGGAAKISAGQVGELAEAISNKVGVDDEAVQSGANLLLTFTNIRNEVGKGNDIFNQATSMITDMSAALNNGEVTAQGMKASSIQLGKALNDPIKGVTALQKVGVSFTADQKKQIKTLVDSGNTLGAQKIILAELKREFGGAAAAAANPLDRLKVFAGNLGEEIGGHLLPKVAQFAGFLQNDAVPAIRAVFDLLRTGDFTGSIGDALGVDEDSRIVGFLLGVRNAAISTFGFISDEALPRLRDFAGFINNNVVPTVERLGGGLLRDKDILIPLVAAVGGAVGVLTAIAVVTKAWAIAQGILNVVLTANPIGLVIVGIAALAAGLVIAYRKSETFRTIVNAAFSVVKTAGSIMWTILKPVFWLFGQALQVIWGRAQLFGQIVSTAFGAIKEPAKTALKFVIGHFLGFVETILTGAAKAFGWVPELGPKLKTAAGDFAKFRDDVNRKLDGIDDEVVQVAFGVSKGAPLGKNKLAAGGPVWGRGTSTSDSIDARLSNNEHVVTAREVKGAGGHGAVAAMRAIWAHGFAGGGPVGLIPQARVPSGGAVNRVLGAVAQDAGRELARLWSLGPGGPPGRVGTFRGHKLNSRTVNMLLAAERVLGRVFRIMQGSYSTRVAASGSTHAGGGAMDTDGPGGWGRAVGALRRVGFAAWHRTPSQGPWGHHIHAIARGDPTASPAAKRQVRDYLRGGDGLGGFAVGGPVSSRHLGRFARVFSFDQGGQWPSGTVGVNTSGRTETVLTGDQSALTPKRIADAVRDGTREALRAGVRIEQRGGSAYLMAASNG